MCATVTGVVYDLFVLLATLALWCTLTKRARLQKKLGTKQNEKAMSYCVYYQAEVKKKDVWFFVATLRSFEHLAFDRTCDVEASVFEFFVPADLEDFFITCLLAYQARTIVVWFEKKPNRLAEPGAVF